MERFEYCNDDPATPGQLEVDADLQTGRLWARSHGHLSIRQANAFIADWTREVRRVHLARGRVFALVDMSESAMLSADAIGVIQRATFNLYMEGDSVAVLVPTNLAKMEMRRTLVVEHHEFFLSRSAAETWLEGRMIAHRRGRRH